MIVLNCISTAELKTHDALSDAKNSTKPSKIMLVYFMVDKCDGLQGPIASK